MKRHFTATGFVVHEGKTLLLWHQKLQQWMPPGGHLLPDEDPVTGVQREVREETGLTVELLRLSPTFPSFEPQQLPAPYTILLEDITEQGEVHQHIDLIYFSRSLDGKNIELSPENSEPVWVTEEQLQRNDGLHLASRGEKVRLAEDVRALALEAIRADREADGN